MAARCIEGGIGPEYTEPRRSEVPSQAWKSRHFHIRFHRAEEGGYVVTIPEMPGCVTEADTFEEGLEMIKDALEGLLEVAVEDGDPIPEQFQEVVTELVKPAAAAKPRAVRSGA